MRTEIVPVGEDVFQSHVRVHELKRDPEVNCIIVVDEELPQCIVHRRRQDRRWSAWMVPLPELSQAALGRLR